MEEGKYYVYTNSGGHWLFKIIKLSNKVAAKYIHGKQYKITDSIINLYDKVRPAIDDEINHLNQCIDAGDYVEYQKPEVRETYLLY